MTTGIMDDETLRIVLDQAWAYSAAVGRKLEAHIDALTAQRDRARDIAVSLEQELAEVADLVRWRDNQRDPGAGQVIAEFDAVAKAALRDTTTITAWNATPAVHPVGDES